MFSTIKIYLDGRQEVLSLVFMNNWRQISATSAVVMFVQLFTLDIDYPPKRMICGRKNVNWNI